MPHPKDESINDLNIFGNDYVIKKIKQHRAALSVDNKVVNIESYDNIEPTEFRKMINVMLEK